MRRFNVLSPASALELQTRLRQRHPVAEPPRPGWGGTVGQLPFLVKCTSATAATGSGVGAQCYPAVILDTDATLTAPPALGEVWLTVLGVGGEAEAPTEGSVYAALMSGDFDPGSDNRPRVFAVGAGGGGAGDCAGGCGSLTGILDDWCLKLSLVCATGEFAGMDADQFAGVYAFGSSGTWRFKTWVDGSPGSWDDFDFEWYTGSTGVPQLTFSADGTPVLTIDAATDKTMRLSCLGSSATFAGGPQNGFDGDATLRAALAECDPNEFVLKVECSCCPPDGWEGPGWYCVEDTGPDDCYPVELLDGDECDDALVICSGPYATEEDAEAECPPLGPPDSACQSHAFTNATATISNKTGNCTCIPDTIAAGTQGTDSASFGVTNPPCSNAGGIFLTCSGGNYVLAVGSTDSITLVGTNLPGDPIRLVYDVDMSSSGLNPCTGTFRIEITDP